jgi:hypothetical protein
MGVGYDMPYVFMVPTVLLHTIPGPKAFLYDNGTYQITFFGYHLPLPRGMDIAIDCVWETGSFWAG